MKPFLLADGELARRSSLLNAISLASAQIVAAADWRNEMPTLLRELGRAAEVSRVSLFEAHSDPLGQLVQSCRYDWVVPPFRPMAGDPHFIDMALKGPDGEFGDWTRRRQRGEVVQATIHEVTGDLLEAYVKAEAKSFLSVPIMVRNQWWGFLGFDDCWTVRTWSGVETDVLRTAANLIAAAIERENAVAETRRRSAMLRAIGHAAPRFLTAARWQAEIAGLLRELGVATDVSRVTLFEAHRNAAGHLVQSCRFDWAEPPLATLSQDPRYRDMSLADDDQEPGEIGAWTRRRQLGEVVEARLGDLTGYTRQVFLEHGTKSFISVPVFCGDDWWGWLGFDDCKRERRWSAADVDVLRTAAALVGGAIERTVAGERLHLSEERYALAARGANDGLWDWDIANETAYFSPRLHQILGLADKELGHDFDNFIARLTPEDARRLRDKLAQRFVRASERIRIELKLASETGHIRVLLLRGLIVYDDFKPRRAVGSLRDITDWVEAQRELREAEARRARLARYFSPNMVEELMRSGGSLATARSQTVTVLFADIMDFSRLSASIPAIELIDLLREYLGLAEEAVFSHGGTLDKFLGDGLLATFGTPHRGPRDAANAVACARAMAASVRAWNMRRAAAGLEPWRIGIGIHSGEAVLGDIGSTRRMEFAVVGETVNAASRIESMTRPLQTGILVSDAVISAVRAEGVEEVLEGFQDLGHHGLRGHARQLRLWGRTIET